MTSMAMESSPPARRVQTAAEARVHGIAAATMKPPAKSVGKTRPMVQAAIGISTMLMVAASNVGSGLATCLIMSVSGTPSAMIKITLTTIVVRSPFGSANHKSDDACHCPRARIRTRAIRNQLCCRAFKGLAFILWNSKRLVEMVYAMEANLFHTLDACNYQWKSDWQSGRLEGYRCIYLTRTFRWVWGDSGRDWESSMALFDTGSTFCLRVWFGCYSSSR